MELRNLSFSSDGKKLRALDQTRLPGEVVYEEYDSCEEIVGAIKLMKVRGAPAIGIAAAMGIAVIAGKLAEECQDSRAFLEELSRQAEIIAQARPTAVNLSWAAKRMMNCAMGDTEGKPKEIAAKLKALAQKIYDEDTEICRKIAENGLTLIKDGDGILTHCNAGPLATSRYGTGLGPIILGLEKGMKFHCFVDETRPLLQGARLTAFELMNAGAEVSLACDSAAAQLMRSGAINAVFVGCDRVAANGDTANKVGTSTAAIAAKYYGVPFYVFCPSPTIDLSCKSGEDIVIEQRDEWEVAGLYFNRQIAPKGVKCVNPAFDITDGKLITAIVTEKGICRPPYEESLKNAAIRRL